MKKIEFEEVGKAVLKYQNTSFYDNPTYNCQLFSMGGFNYLFMGNSNKKIVEVLRQISKKYKKDLMLVDIARPLYNSLDSCFINAFITKKYYKNKNTNNKMVLGIIDITKLTI